MTAHYPPTLFFLFTTFPPEVTGSAIFNWERVQWLAKQRRYRVVVLAPAWKEAAIPPVPPALEQTLIIETYPSKPWFIYSLLRVPTFAAADHIRQRLAYYQPNLVTVVDLERLFWFGTWHLPGRRYAQSHNIPYITEYHTDYYGHLGAYPGGKLVRELLLKSVNRYLYHQCNVTLSVSPAASKGLKQIGVTNVQEVKIYGINTSAYSPAHRDRQCLESWLTPEEHNHTVLIFLGRLAFEKRLDLLIEAFKQLKPQYPNCSLVIAGDGPTEVVSSLKKLAGTTPHIHFTGFVHGATKVSLLASCDIYCSPSAHETFGLSVLEAMASGLPVVTVNSGGVMGYMVDGVNGYLAPADDVDGFTHAIEKSLLTDNTEVIQNGLQTAKKFSVESGCEKLDHYYQNLLVSQEKYRVHPTFTK